MDDEYASASENDPKILVTTSRNSIAPLTQFIKELKFVSPNAQRMNRGDQVTRHDIKDKKAIGTMPEAYPHLILNNFSTKLGQRTANILKHLFPVPKPDTKRIITFANQSDYCSFRKNPSCFNSSMVRSLLYTAVSFKELRWLSQGRVSRFYSSTSEEILEQRLRDLFDRDYSHILEILYKQQKEEDITLISVKEFCDIIFKNNKIGRQIFYDYMKKRRLRVQNDCILTPLLKSPIVRVTWLPPPSEFVKINTDASFDEKSGRSSGGVVVRSSYRGVLVMVMCEFKNIKTSLEGEVEALELGMFVGSRLGVGRAIFEVDNGEVASYLRSRQDIPSDFFLKFMNLPIHLFEDYDVNHILREANQVADVLAGLYYGGYSYRHFYISRLTTAFTKHFMDKNRYIFFRHRLKEQGIVQNDNRTIAANSAKRAEEVENSSHQVGANCEDSSSPKENYPKGSIIAFTLKSVSAGGSAEQKEGHQPSSEYMNVCKADGDRDSVLNATEEAEEMVLECVNGDKEIPGENIEKVTKEKVDEKSSLESKGKESDDGENPDSSIGKDNDEAAREGKTTAFLYRDNKECVMHEDLKAVFQKYGTIKFIDFKIGADSGYIQFEEPEAAQKAHAAAALADEYGLVVKNFIATLDPVTGEAEREYWSLFRGNQE